MAKAKNKVVLGAFGGSKVFSITDPSCKKSVFGKVSSCLAVMNGGFNHILLNQKNITQWQNMNTTETTSGTSAVMRLSLGAAFLGVPGLILGATAKKNGIYQIAVQLNTGEQFLMEIDKKLYEIFIASAGYSVF